MSAYDALVVISFGGPEAPEEVLPFLENVVRGRQVSRRRLLEVAEHYRHFGGTSPINSQNRQLISALEAEFAENGLSLPVYWGNRNWHPFLADTLRRMSADGIRRALAFVTSAFGSYSGCRQYREDISRAQQEVGPRAPHIDKLRLFFNHPGFVEPMIECVRRAFAEISNVDARQVMLVFTAHSIPLAMAQSSPYEVQLHETCRLIAAGVGTSNWRLVYQSRSGPPGQPWLEPDVYEFLRDEHRGSRLSHVVMAPIGFISDHMEVVYDLDFEAGALCHQLSIQMVRAATVGTHPRFVQMVRELVVERMDASAPRLALGTLGASPDECSADCCVSIRQQHRG
jgi:ferrochelatase